MPVLHSINDLHVGRGMKPKVLEAEFEIVTPMFLGGAEHEASRIRGTAVKGALAFWWRALNFARFVKEQGGDANKALEAMRTRERALFGSSQEGLGAFLLRVEERKDGKLETIEPPAQLRMKSGGLEGDVIGVGARYLGYGIINAFYSRVTRKKEGELERNCFAAGQRFSLELAFRPNANAADIEEIIDALKLFGLLGGLGARMRRGWGSVALISLTAENLPEGVDAAWQAPESREDYIARLKELFIGHPSLQQSGTDWLLTAFAKESQIHVGTNGGSNPLDVLNNLGNGFLRYRGWRNGDRNFKDDHDWFKTDKGDPKSFRCPPKRTAFGLPHNYAKWLGVTAPDDAKTEPKKEYDRRASPILFHIHKTQDGQCFYVVTYMPTRFMFIKSVAVRKNDAKRPVEYDFVKAGMPVIEAFLNNRKPDGSIPTNDGYLKAEKVLP